MTVTDEVAKAKIASGVRQHRARLDLTQAELASRADLNRVYISQVERGYAMPTVATLLRLADALETTVSDLLGET